MPAASAGRAVPNGISEHTRHPLTDKRGDLFVIGHLHHHHLRIDWSGARYPKQRGENDCQRIVRRGLLEVNSN
ncbi:MAG TPA: hypothetical protein VGC76_18335 [Pyrinomonadaceae bacterium]